MQTLPFSTEVLQWATGRAGLTLDAFAQSVARRDEARKRIAQGLLTPSQARELAKQARVPFGYLFLSLPPEVERQAIPDLRQTRGPQVLSDDFWETLEDVRAKQRWMVEHLRELGAAQNLDFVGRFAKAARGQHTDIANDIAKVLRISDEDRRASADSSAYFSRLSAKVERGGILVFKKGFVKGNTRRPLSEKEFRGFAIAHPQVPVVFVNGRDAPAATVFTLLHEVAHIWLGEDGVSGAPSLMHDHQIEVLCNRVAADVLLPSNAFAAAWCKYTDVYAVARLFKVSAHAAAVRALDAGFIGRSEYENIACAVPESQKADKGKGGPSALTTIPIYNSKRFTRAIVASAMNGHTMLRDAANLLNAKPDTVLKLADEVLHT